MTGAAELVLSRRAFSAFLIAAPAAALGGCVGGGAAPTTFDLSAVLDGDLRGTPSAGGQILVAEPTAIQAYDGERILAKSIARGLSFLPNAQWADRLPALIQTRLVQTLENSNRFRNVGRVGDALDADLTLITDIRAFEAEEATREAVVTLSAKIVASDSGRILRGTVFSARHPVATIDGPGASAALDAALGEVLVAIATWA
jgi:cholesterol transport system auxiliary component